LSARERHAVDGSDHGALLGIALVLAAVLVPMPSSADPPA